MSNIPRYASPLLTALVAGPVLLLLASCTAKDPQTPKYDTQPPRDLVIAPDYVPPGCPNPPTLAPPLLNPAAPAVTSYATQPLRGTCAAPGGNITSSGGVATASAPVGSGGSFCIEVRLIQDALNTLNLTCVDNRGCPGSPKKIQITHKTLSTVDSGISSPVNLARGQPITSLATPDSGRLGYVVDGDTKSQAVFSFWDIELSGKCDRCTWVKVDLGKVYTINKFRIYWGPQAGSNYAICYTLLLSSKAAPANPDCSSNIDWKAVVQETSGVYQSKDITSFAAEGARWAALLMYENASSGLSETFHLAELEVWGQDPNATPPQPPERCK
jgi:hypothetical protein